MAWPSVRKVGADWFTSLVKNNFIFSNLLNLAYQENEWLWNCLLQCKGYANTLLAEAL